MILTCPDFHANISDTAGFIRDEQAIITQLFPLIAKEGEENHREYFLWHLVCYSEHPHSPQAVLVAPTLCDRVAGHRVLWMMDSWAHTSTQEP